MHFNKGIFDRSHKTGATNVLCRIQRNASRLRDAMTRFLRQYAKTRAFAPSNNSSRHSCEEREFRSTPANWQGMFVGKSDLAVKGENDG